MGLLFEEIQMIRELHKYLDQGGKDIDYLNAKIALLSQSDKRQKTIIHVLSLLGKYKNGSNVVKRLYATNLITEYEAISCSPISFEKQIVICSILDEEITRGKCLERSGEKSHYDECKGCEIGLTTKKLLCPPEQEHV